MHQLAVQKDRLAELVFIFPVGKVRQKQWLASLKLVNPPVQPKLPDNSDEILQAKVNLGNS